MHLSASFPSCTSTLIAIVRAAPASPAGTIDQSGDAVSMVPAGLASTPKCLAPGTAAGCTLQVSCFGDDGTTDSGDLWRVEWDGKEKHWLRDAPVRFVHKDTGSYLSNHNVQYQRPIPGHTEVRGTPCIWGVCRKGKDWAGWCRGAWESS